MFTKEAFPVTGLQHIPVLPSDLLWFTGFDKNAELVIYHEKLE
jgi:hypothetical protein